MILTDEDIENLSLSAVTKKDALSDVREIEAAVINKLATVEGGPVRYEGRWLDMSDQSEGWSEWRNVDNIDLQRWKNRISQWPDSYEVRPLYTAEQVAAARAQDAAEIERLKQVEEENKRLSALLHITRVERNGMAIQRNQAYTERDAMQAEIAVLEADAGRWKKAAKALAFASNNIISALGKPSNDPQPWRDARQDLSIAHQHFDAARAKEAQ